MPKKEESVHIYQIYVRVGEYSVTLGNLLSAVNQLCAAYPTKSLKTLQASLIGFSEYVFALASPYKEEPPYLPEQRMILTALEDYNGSCNFYFLVNNSKIVSTQELILLCDSKQDAKLNRLTALLNLLPKLNMILLGFQAELLSRLKKDERRMRGLDLSMTARIKQNVEFLRGNLDNALFSDLDMTVGRYYHAPLGMEQDHAVLAVDMLTGVIFIPRHINRLASFITARYEQMEKDAATLDYVFAAPNLRQKPIIALPKGYAVLPLKFIIDNSELSAEAKDVMKETELQLFAPIVELLNAAKKRTMPPETLEALQKLRRQME